MNKTVFSGKTLEEAIDIACDEINIDPEYLYYNVLEEKKGLFTKKVEIEAYTLTDVIEYAENYLLQIIKDYGLEGKAINTLNEGIIKITLDTSHNSILIGKNGKTLQALNEMVRNATSNYFCHRFRILLDINDYKDGKYDKIVRMAKKVAFDVQKSKVTAVLDPMTSDERRIVHNALSHIKHIRTESSGHGHKRQINIIYTEEEIVEQVDGKKSEE